ncbi:MAG: hypothetical protein WC386_01160, partial [Candidatus Paceibacterota bacterium]
MKKKTIISIIIVLILVITAGYFACNYYTKKGENNTPVSENNNPESYTKQYSVSGTGDLESKFIEYQTKLEEAVKAYKEGGEKPNPDYFIEKARYAQYLKHNDWAKEILNDVFNYYDNSSPAWNNLAKIAEEEKDYVKANEYYQKMIDSFGEEQYWSYYYYIC